MTFLKEGDEMIITEKSRDTENGTRVVLINISHILGHVQVSKKIPIDSNDSVISLKRESDILEVTCYIGKDIKLYFPIEGYEFFENPRVYNDSIRNWQPIPGIDTSDSKHWYHWSV